MKKQALFLVAVALSVVMNSCSRSSFYAVKSQPKPHQEAVAKKSIDFKINEAKATSLPTPSTYASQANTGNAIPSQVQTTSFTVVNEVTAVSVYSPKPEKPVLGKAGSKTKSAHVKATGKAEKKSSPKTNGSGDKSWIVTLLLCFFLGGLGIHRFYLGYTWQGVVQLLTLGGCGIWALIDFIRIITKDLKPKNGDYND